MEKLKLLLGGSPCTRWSIAQAKNRETEPSGIGWELFLNYKIALLKYKPDYFLYENNKSMSTAIRAQITRELGVEPIEINSALVSAQSRKRLYWTNIPSVELPEDRGILLRDILEAGVVWKEKAYTLRASHGPHGGPSSVIKTIKEPGKFSFNGVAEPVRIGTIESAAKNADFDSQQYRVYSPDGKSVTLCSQGGGVGTKAGLYATPVRVGTIESEAKNADFDSHHYRVYSPDGKSVTICFHGSDVETMLSAHGERTNSQGRLVIVAADGKEKPVFSVQDGQITIKGKQYPIKLADGFYIIRKLTVTECKRLQTVPDDYVFPVSDTQAYKMLGNGWTVDVIVHILSYVPGITEEPLEVLSMYDGMSCGRLALDKLGASVAAYWATEIDKYAIKTTMANYPYTVQLGDAFQVREGSWKPWEGT